MTDSANTPHKTHHPVAIANYLVEKAALERKALDIYQLVKLVYEAHGWCLGITGRPLLSTRIEAWKYGPVVPEVYEAFRVQGSTIRARAKDENGRLYMADMDSEQTWIVDKVYRIFKDMDPLRLAYLAREEGTPWHEVRATGAYYCPIPNSTIHAYYRNLVEAEAVP